MGTRVYLDSTVLKLIAEIKAATGNHTDDEIYAMLKECNFNADETAQKLLYLDTFHVVKRKHKKPPNARTAEGPRFAGPRGRGPRDGQGNYSSQNANGATSGRKSNAQRENGVADRPERNQKSSVPVVEKTSNVTSASTTKSSSASLGIAKSTHATVNDVESSESQLKKTPVKPSQTQSPVTSSEVVKGSSVPDEQFSAQRDSLSKEVASDSATSAAADSSQSLNEPDLPSLESTTEVLDLKENKLNSSSFQPVIFPEHLQVPEELIYGLTFGSFDSPSDQEVEHVNVSDEVKVSLPTTEPLKEKEEIEKDISLSNEIGSSSAQETENPDNSQSPPLAPESSSNLEDDVPSDATLKNDQPKPEVKLPFGGNQYPFVAAPNYSFPFAAHFLGNQTLQSEGVAQQSESAQVSSSTPATSQPAALSPPPFPIFRHPYQPGYLPFSPYYHPYYYSPTGQPMLGQGGFPQQPSNGNAYLAAAAAAGGKYPVQPSQSGLNAGSVPPYGIPAGYGTYSPGLAPSSGSSAGTQDLTTSAFKDNTVYTTVQQADGSMVWAPPAVRDVSGLPAAASFYNQHVPQGHRLTLPPSQGGYASPGAYHQAQLMAAAGSAANTHPHMQQHLSQQAAAGSNEAMRSASGAYQQQQQQQQAQQRNALNWTPNY